MWFLKFVTLSCILYALTRNSDAVSCGKGQMLYGGTCVPCPNGFYQPEKTTSQSCEACRKCHESKGSSILRNCTSEENTICKCKSNFVAQEDDSSTCKCRPEFTQQSNECVKKKKKKPNINYSNYT
ncbi:hypothetical protein NL108_010858 [Boleophthalmus pectinirostris]|nr:hypothetical protein NL108_010858 [Boleophthalmus pectinirostris]